MFLILQNYPPKTSGMKSIKFSENELEFLKNHYELELADAENYVSEIKNILAKLNKLEKPVIVEKTGKKTGKKRGRPRKETKASEELPAPVKEAVVKTVKEKPGKEKTIKSKVKEAPKKVSSKKKTVKKRKPAPKKVVKKQIPVAPPAETPIS